MKCHRCKEKLSENTDIQRHYKTMKCTKIFWERQMRKRAKASLPWSDERKQEEQNDVEIEHKDALDVIRTSKDLFQYIEMQHQQNLKYIDQIYDLKKVIHVLEQNLSNIEKYLEK